MKWSRSTCLQAGLVLWERSRARRYDLNRADEEQAVLRTREPAKERSARRVGGVPEGTKQAGPWRTQAVSGLSVSQMEEEGSGSVRLCCIRRSWVDQTPWKTCDGRV